MSVDMRAGVGDPAAAPASYRGLINTPGIGPLLTSALLTRTAVQVWEIGIILFALQRYHSAGLAGLSIFMLVFPGLLMSPINGALLDRYGRRRLMSLDFIVAAACLLTIVGLAATNRLPAWALLMVLTAGSLTSTLSVAGARSLFPLIVPTGLWDRANAADSLCYGVATIAGPGIAGFVTASLGSEAALLVAAIAYLLAVVAVRRVREPATVASTTGHILRDAWRGLRYVLSNLTLRWLALALSVGNIGLGVIIVALPVIVFRLHGNAAAVGGLLALQGAVGIPATLLAGRIRTDGRERWIMAVCFTAIAIATLGLLIPAILGVACALAVIGIADGPLNVSLFSLRQRRTDPRWFGRAFAVSMSLNFAGMPLGSAVSGPLLAASITVAVVLAAGLALVAASVTLTLIPATTRPS